LDIVHLVEAVVMNIAIGTPRPRAVRVLLFAENAVTVAIDAQPRSISRRVQRWLAS